MGALVTVVTHDDLAQAQSYADELAGWIYERRRDWQLEMPDTRTALRLAHDRDRYPVVFADRNDTTGGGAPGDSTGMLRTFLDEQLSDACILYIVDPEAVRACNDAGLGASIPLLLGGKSTPEQGPPVSLHAQVVAISDGQFQYTGPMYAGLIGNLGPSAWVRQDGVHVLVVSTREQPYDTAFAESVGLDPKRMRYVGVKSAARFRAAFSRWAQQIHVVSESSVHSPQHVRSQRLGRRVYPLE